ncbi:hypothetical protein [Spirillospora sp. CA-294931]|uniref:hypothetical protein n=1 Tax=Spirillospora sp. CA-294931 TaxID=3240042 RepID=UPI003D933938
MNDELETLLRNHYRRAADEIHADGELVRRLQDAGPQRRPARRRWALPMVAAGATAAVVVIVALFLWPGPRQERAPRPVAPPSRTVQPTPIAPLPTYPPSGGLPPVYPPGVQTPSATPEEPTPLPTGEATPSPTKHPESPLPSHPSNIRPTPSSTPTEPAPTG